MRFSCVSRLRGSRWILWFAAASLAVLLFVDFPGHRFPRSLAAAWDLGHVAAFFLWSRLLMSWSPVRDAPPRRRWGSVLAFCLVAGAATEGIQHVSGGDVSAWDVLRDALGGFIALCRFSPVSDFPSTRSRRISKTIAASLLVAACLPLLAMLGEEQAARTRFPVLSDFETPFEAGRWKGNAAFSRDGSAARHGKASLRMDMDTSPFSGVDLVHFPGDWRGFRFLKMDVLNPSPEDIRLTCRIHDRRHEEGDQRYGDRYNQAFLLPPGWNEIRIDLDEVARAPAGRSLDLGKVSGVGIFATRLPAPRTVFLDHVRLE